MSERKVVVLPSGKAVEIFTKAGVVKMWTFSDIAAYEHDDLDYERYRTRKFWTGAYKVAELNNLCQQSATQQQRISELEREVAGLRAVQAHYEQLLSLARFVTEHNAPESDVTIANLAHYVYKAEKPALVE